MDRLVRDSRVVGDRLRADVVGGHRDAPADDLRRALLAVLVRLARDRVALLDLELGIVDPARARQRIQERVLVQVVRLELEQVADVVHTVAGVVDVDPVVRAVIEPVEVRAARGILERDPVGYDREVACCVWRSERVDVCVVRGWVQRRQRPAKGRAGPPTRTKPVVRILEESFSFDHYLGTSPRASGRTPDLRTNTPTGATPRRYSPSNLNDILTCDQDHSYNDEQKAF